MAPDDVRVDFPDELGSFLDRRLCGRGQVLQLVLHAGFSYSITGQILTLPGQLVALCVPEATAVFEIQGVNSLYQSTRAESAGAMP